MVVPLGPVQLVGDTDTTVVDYYFDVTYHLLYCENFRNLVTEVFVSCLQFISLCVSCEWVIYDTKFYIYVP